LEILWFDALASTQTHLVSKIKAKELTAPICVASNTQTEGIGSRGNSWESTQEALLFSFAVPLSGLPKDLKIESASIYFMYILKELLAEKGSKCWFKWPNDIYIDDKKIAGVLTTLVKNEDVLVCGIGLNFFEQNEFGKCDIKTDKKSLLCEYLSVFTAPPEWKRIFIKFEVEFLKTRANSPYSERIKYLENATLNSDGSLTIEDKKVFSLR
jgi:BirA family transcriptional regulator, biotin operon repressor / biotin---[acetyl-CoA-carboxylase] ligase